MLVLVVMEKLLLCNPAPTTEDLRTTMTELDLPLEQTSLIYKWILQNWLLREMASVTV